jgi:hypothetical protein
MPYPRKQNADNERSVINEILILDSSRELDASIVEGSRGGVTPQPGLEGRDLLSPKCLVLNC